MSKYIPIIILNWNGIEDTIECINSVLKLQDTSFKVYLVDNGSYNHEGEKLQGLFKKEERIQVILNEKNLGFTQGNNKILENLLNENFEYIVLLNNDTVVTPTWLKCLVDGARYHGADMVSSKMINYYDRSIMDNAGHFMLNTAEILPIAHAEPIDKYNTAFENMGACGGAALYSSKMLENIGLFDPFFTTGYEDAELGLRAKLLGYKIIYEPTAIVYHKVSRSIQKIRDDDYFVKIQSNIFYTYLKLLPKRYIITNLPWIFLKYLMLFIGSVLTLRIRIINLHFKTIVYFMSRGYKIALKSRADIYNRFRTQIDRNAPKKIMFFLGVDIKRFVSLFTRKQYKNNFAIYPRKLVLLKPNE